MASELEIPRFVTNQTKGMSFAFSPTCHAAVEGLARIDMLCIDKTR